MATTDLTLEILTPAGPAREPATVPAVEVPGLLGELGVLPEHEPFVTAVSPGVVRFRDGAASARVAVGSGFMEVTPQGRVHVVVDRAALAEDIDTDAVQLELDSLSAEAAGDAGGPTSAPEQRARADRRGWLEAQLRAASATH